jgi:hypothetical protein
MKQPNFKGNVNGIEYQLQLRGGLYALRFTDPRSHERCRVSTKSKTVTGARGFATQYLNQYVPGQSTSRVTVGDLVADLLAFKLTHQPRDHHDSQARWGLRMESKFGNWDARELWSRDVEEYKSWCLGHTNTRWAAIDQPLSKGPINKDLALLSRAYNMGVEDNVISTKPKFRKYSTDESIRKGFLLQHEYDAIMAVSWLPLWLRGLLCMA